jgi:hypothetical protein
MRGLHCHDFPLLLWDALVQTGYGDRAPEYCGRLYEEHGLQCCEVYINIPSHPMHDAMEKAAHMALTALCSQNLAATAGTPISLYPIQDLSDPEWKACIDEVGNVFHVHYHSG